jgi:hypothetical protein
MRAILEPRGQRVDDVSNGGNHVLAVVDHEQDIPFGETESECILIRLVT